MPASPSRPLLGAAFLALLSLAVGCSSTPPVVPDDVIEVVEQVLPGPGAADAPAECTPRREGLTGQPAPQALVGVPLRAPVQCQSNEDGRLVRDLYVQFSSTTIAGASSDDGGLIDRIWTRAYGLDPVDYAREGLPTLDIPGPTFVYHPGDWLQLTLINQLNASADPLLVEFEDALAALSSQDDIEEPVSHDLNIPHNADNTNLHVHGMHVDPKQDDVTLIILPEDDNPSHYTPMLQHYVPDINRWWRWTYGYRLPQDHLPGTHWYHDHKHGATSTHVENGMAGTLIVRPHDDADALVPGLWNDDPALSNDVPIVLQEIANYGAQQGSGRNIGDPMTIERQSQNTDQFTTDWPEITVNGQQQPVRAIAQGQTQRWRIVTAGSNHRVASYLWVAKLTPPESMSPTLYAALDSITDRASAQKYLQIGGTAALPKFPVAIDPFPGTVQMVAFDGVTINAPLDLTLERPALVGPGNRVDLIVRPDLEAPLDSSYYLIKNLNVAPPQYALAENPSYGHLFADPEAGYWRYLALTTNVGGTAVQNTYRGVPVDSTHAGQFVSPLGKFTAIQSDPYALGGNQTGHQVSWPAAVAPDGATTPAATPSKTYPKTSVVPLLKGRADGNRVSPVIVGGVNGAGHPEGVGWSVVTRVAGGGIADVQSLMRIRIGPGDGSGPQPPDSTRLRLYSPTTPYPAETRLVRSVTPDSTVRGIPAYVSPITADDLEGRQVVVFDRSGVKFQYIQRDAARDSVGTTAINQFSLNGRQFDLNDFVGNPNADALIDDPVPPVVPDVWHPDALGTYAYNGAGAWSNLVRIGPDSVETALYTNPGYYVPIAPGPVVAGDSTFTFSYHADAPPTYTAITGLDAPLQPVATTAEEWMLVNNSGSFHPFHIHISPLFLTEVGQLTYDASAPGRTKWSLLRIDASNADDHALGYMIDNWWDVVMIPPYGYVKFRTWMNIPNQRPEDPTDPDTDFVVDENANVFGSWVYHCHILRHEDRGMMMVVNVRPKPEPAAGGAGGGH